MRFLPQTETEIAQMLETVGAASIEDLIAHVPAELRQTAAIKLAPGLSEAQVAAKLEALAALDSGANKFRSFLGAGYYRHCIPAAVRTIMARSEFATSYTPYQPEASQGTLQAIFEFQTLITQLTGLEVANASMYDGASAAAEAVLMARRMLPSRDVVALSRGLWPDYRLAIRTYLSALAEIEVVEIPFDSGSGMIGNRSWRRRAVNQRHRGTAGAGTAQSAGRSRHRYRGGRGSKFRIAAPIRRSWRGLFRGQVGPRAAIGGPSGG
jgi:glycine dehydrogenase subunit 1